MQVLRLILVISQNATHTCKWHDSFCATHTCKWYGVATVCKIDKIIGLFCRISSQLYVSFVYHGMRRIHASDTTHYARLIHGMWLCVYVYTYVCVLYMDLGMYINVTGVDVRSWVISVTRLILRDSYIQEICLSSAHVQQSHHETVISLRMSHCNTTHSSNITECDAYMQLTRLILRDSYMQVIWGGSRQ